MPLIPAVLKAHILTILNKQALKSNESDDPATSRDELAGELAEAITNYIRTATVTTPSGPGTIL